MARAKPRPTAEAHRTRGASPWTLGRPGAALLAALACFAAQEASALEAPVAAASHGAVSAATAAQEPNAGLVSNGNVAASPNAPTPASVSVPNAADDAPVVAPASVAKPAEGVLSSTAWGGRGIVRVASAFPLSRGAFTLTARVAYFRSTGLFARGVADSESNQGVHVAYSPIAGLELALSQHSVAHSYATTPSRSLQFQGDPTLRIKYGRRIAGPWAVGLLGRLTLPTVEGGAKATFAAAEGGGTALVSVQPWRRVEFTGNVGFDYARARHVLRNEVPDVVERFVFGIDATPSAHWGVGVVGRATAGRRLDLLPFGEIVGHIGTKRASNAKNSPVQASFGLRGYPTRSRAVEIVLGADVRVAGAPSAGSPFAGLPPWRAFGQVTVHLGEGTERAHRGDEERPSFCVRGTVLDDATGQPVVGAYAYVPGDPSPLLFAADEQTGRFGTAPQPGGRGTLRIVAQAPGYDPVEQVVPRSRNGRDVEINLRLRAEASSKKLALLKGSLKDATTGAAVVGAEVFLPTLGRTLRSDATGSFAALVKPGRYNATLRAPGYVSQRKLLVLQPGDSMVLNVDFEPVPASAP